MANDGVYTAALREVATDYGGVSSASLNLTVRCSVTTVDLCAAALARLDGRTPPADREFDARDAERYYRNYAPGTRVAPLATPFLTRLASSSWSNTKLLRDEVTHKRYTRGLYATSRRPSDPPPLAFPQQIDVNWGTAGMVALDTLTRMIVEFAEETFREFCGNLAGLR